MRPKALMTVSHLGERSLTYLRAPQAAGFDVSCNRLGRPYTEDELLDALGGTFGVIARGEPTPSESSARQKT